MRLSLVSGVVGTLVRLYGAALAAPLLVSVMYGERHDAIGFALGLTACVAVGTLMRRAGGPGPADVLDDLRRIEGLAIVAFTWLIAAHLSALPYLWIGLPAVDALFEAMSGLTASGATILTDFDAYGRGFFFWRALSHWLGGIGVIALFVAILPRLAIAGRQMFFAESPGPDDEKLTPQLRQTALALWRLYSALTFILIVALSLAGMPIFDAVCNAMSTMSAGGFSPHGRSIAGYDSAAIEWIVTIFMFIAGANFLLQYRSLRFGYATFRRDEEFRLYTAIAAAATTVLAVILVTEGLTAGEAVRHGAFQVLSIMTTTGLASTDTAMWSDQAKIVLFLLMFVGGCSGSASGGPKVVRHLLIARYTLRELKRAVHPRAVLPVKHGGRVVPEDIVRDVLVFMLFYLLTFAVGAAIVVALGADLLTGLSASAAALGNVGPGFGDIGPMSSFADLHPVSKVVLSLQMWIGRLEVLTVLVFFRWEAWRSSHWQA